MSTSPGPSIGIDLGSAFSTVGVWQHDHVEIIANELGKRTTPSYVTFKESEILVGDVAKNEPVTKLGNSIFNLKKVIGRKFTDEVVLSAMEQLPFSILPIENDNLVISIQLNGVTKTFSPEQISAIVLSKMKEIAESYLSLPVSSAVITVPSYFNYSQRLATRAAGTLAGLNVTRIMIEPTAAAIAYGLSRKRLNDMEKELTIVIFDLGSITFDVSVLTMYDGVIEMKASEHMDIGGDKFDKVMVNHFVAEFQEMYKMDPSEDTRAMSKLYLSCERAKRLLSSATHVTVEIDAFYKGHDLFTSMKRSDFEKLCMPLFHDILNVVKQLLDQASISKYAVDDVVLVGGSTRIPKIKSLLSDFFNGMKIWNKMNCDEAVAYGAAIQAAILNEDKSEKIQDILVLDVIPGSLGMKVGDEEEMMKMIDRHAKIPTKKMQLFTTCMDNQTSIAIQIYEGEHKNVKENNHLGTVILNDIVPIPHGIIQIEVIFEVDINGLLTVTVVDRTTCRTNRITITNNQCDFGEQNDVEMKVAAIMEKPNDKYNNELHALKKRRSK